MQSDVPPLVIQAIKADSYGIAVERFVAVKGPSEPFLLPGVRLTKIVEKRSHRTLLLRGRHQWNEPIIVGAGTAYRWCAGRDRCEIEIGPGKWVGLAVYRVTGGSSAAVEGWKPVPGPENEPR